MCQAVVNQLVRSTSQLVGTAPAVYIFCSKQQYKKIARVSHKRMSGDCS